MLAEPSVDVNGTDACRSAMVFEDGDNAFNDMVVEWSHVLGEIDGKVFRTLNILDEYNRECLTIWVKRKLNSMDVIDVLADLFILRGIPAFIRSDNGSEFIAEAVRNWISAVGARTAYITPGSP